MILRSINSSTDLISFLLIKIQSSFLLDRLFFFYANRKCSMKNNLAQLLGPPVLPGPFRTTLFWGPKMAPKKVLQRGPRRGLGGGFFEPWKSRKIQEISGPKNPGFGALPGRLFGRLGGAQKTSSASGKIPGAVFREAPEAAPQGAAGNLLLKIIPSPHCVTFRQCSSLTLAS